MGLLIQPDTRALLADLAPITFFVSVGGLTIARWRREKPYWSEPRRTARHVRSAFAVAFCSTEALIVILDHFGFFHHDGRNDSLMVLANIGGLLFLITLCAYVVELVLAVEREPGLGGRIPHRPDVAAIGTIRGIDAGRRGIQSTQIEEPAGRWPGWSDWLPRGRAGTARRRPVDGLTAMRTIWVGLVASLPLYLLAVLSIVPSRGPDPVGPYVATLVLIGTVIVALVAALQRRPLEVSTAERLAETFRRSWSRSIVFAEIPALAGIVLAIVSGSGLAYAIGGMSSLWALYLLAPSERHLQHKQEGLLGANSPLSLRDSLIAQEPSSRPGPRPN